MSELDDLRELARIVDRVIRDLGLPHSLGGPDLPPAVNAMIGAMGTIRRAGYPIGPTWSPDEEDDNELPY